MFLLAEVVSSFTRRTNLGAETLVGTSICCCLLLERLSKGDAQHGSKLRVDVIVFCSSCIIICTFHFHIISEYYFIL